MEENKVESQPNQTEMRQTDILVESGHAHNILPQLCFKTQSTTGQRRLTREIFKGFMMPKGIFMSEHWACAPNKIMQ